MRGRPIIQWGLFLGVWVCLVLPIVMVTRGGQPVQQTQHADGNSVMTWVTLRFSEEPSHFKLLQDDHVLWQETPVGEIEFEHAFPVLIDKFGAEFIFKSRLPAAGVIEIIVEPDARQARSQTLWVDGEVDEILTFSWSQNE